MFIKKSEYKDIQEYASAVTKKLMKQYDEIIELEADKRILLNKIGAMQVAIEAYRYENNKYRDERDNLQLTVMELKRR